MSELNTIHVKKNKERESEAAQRKAAYEQHRREILQRRKRQQTIKYISSFSLIIAAIILCFAYLFGVFDSKEENGSNKKPNVVDSSTEKNKDKDDDQGDDEKPSKPNYVAVVGFDADNYVFIDSMYKFETSDMILEMLTEAANTESEAQEEYQFLLKNKSAYPQGLLYLAVNEPLALEFVIEYPFKSKAATYYFDLSKEMAKKEIPHFLQWDERWGYSAYGDDCMGLDGCGPTCLSMVIVGLTKNEVYNPMSVANYCMQNGFYLDGVGTKWEFFTEGADFFGLTSSQISNDKERMIKELEKGNVLICSMAPGDFTLSGHFIVIWDYVDGEFVVNDPNSVVRSEKTWSYEVLEDQFKAIWTFGLK